jgi:ATP-dependent Clp protease ATP-binding subunit ClpA
MRLRRAERPRTLTTRPALGFLGPAVAQARALGHNYLGTEHLLLALLTHRTGAAVVALERLGITPEQIRDRVLAKLAKPPAPRLDPEALATLGIDLDRVRARIEETFGAGALEHTRQGCMSIAPRAKLALAYAVDEANGRPVNDGHLLIGLLRSRGSIAAQVLAEFDVSPAKLSAMPDR